MAENDKLVILSSTGFNALVEHLKRLTQSTKDLQKDLTRAVELTSASFGKVNEVLSSINDINEIHTVTADEAEAKSFELENEINPSSVSQIWLSVSGVEQVPGVDFDVLTAEGKSSVSWANKALESVPIAEGDTFFIMYKRKVEQPENNPD